MTLRTLTVFFAMLQWISCFCVHAQSAASVDMEAGRRHFDRGVDFYHDGNINAALIEFKRAYATAPNYRVLYNLGQVSNTLGDYTAAQRYFQQYLSDGGNEIDAARRRDVESTLGKLAGRIATIQLSCNVDGAELFVDDVSVGKSPLPASLRVSAGTRRLSALVRGKPRVTRVVEAAGGESLSVRLDLDAMAEAPAQQTLQPSAASESSGPGATLWLGIATGALAVGAGVIGTLAAIDGAKYHDALHRSATASQLDALHDRAQVKAITTDVLLGATAVTGIITVIVWLNRGGQERAPSADTREAQAHVSVGLGSVQLTSHFE